MEQLPEEIIEVIFSYLSPYKEYDIASCVCKNWKRILDGMLCQLPSKFENDVISGNIQSYSVDEGNQVTSVSPRVFQAACYSDYSRSMYVFGGKSIQSTSTGFNDLLCLDMHSLLWNRPAAKGNIPPPKYGCTLDSYKNFLILFGGSSLTPSNTLQRGTCEYYNHLHIYDIITGTWTLKAFLPDECPEELYMPKTCLIADHVDPELDIMILYGGKKKSFGQQEINSSIWCLDLYTWTWKKQTLMCTEGSHSAIDASAIQFLRLKTSSYSSSVLAVNRGMHLMWLMYRTGVSEWTLQKLIRPTENQDILSAYSIHFPTLLVGKTLICFGIFPPLPSFPSLNAISKPIVLHSMCGMKKNNQSNSLLPPNEFSLSFMNILDLRKIEVEGIVECIDQCSESGKLLPDFFIKGLNPATAVMGRGEIILHGTRKLGRDVGMILHIIRGKR